MNGYPYPWLSYDHALDFLKEKAMERTKSKDGSKKRVVMTPAYELLGCIGEWTFGKTVGMEPDWSIYEKGDDHTDFGGTTDVKGTSYYKDPWLRLFRHEPDNKKTLFFACVAINQDEKLARYSGYRTKTHMQLIRRHSLIDLGNGPRVVSKLLILSLPPGFTMEENLWASTSASTLG